MTFPPSDHCNGLRFHNPGGETAPGLTDILRWQAGNLLRRSPACPGPLLEPLTATDDAPAKGSATFLGHASFHLQGRNWNALVDPVFSDVIGPGHGLGYRRGRPTWPGWRDLPEPDFVLVTHNHYDHCDSPTLRRLASLASRPVAVTPLGNGKLLRRMGFQEVVELDWWQSWRSAKGPVVTLTPAIHFSARGPFDRNRSLWGGFYVADGGVSFFAAGDTAYGKHFAEIARRLGPPDLALLPIGAHQPARLMSAIHQGPAEALQAHRDLGAGRSVAFHFGDFRLADDTLHGPAHELVTLRNEAGMAPESFVVPRPGQKVAAG